MAVATLSRFHFQPVRWVMAVARLAVGVLFLTAAVESAANVRPAVAGVMYLMGTERLLGPVIITTLVLFVEGAIGVFLILDWPQRIAPIAGIILLALFSMYILLLASTPLNGHCGCGTLMAMIRGASASSGRMIAINTVLALVLLGVLVYSMFPGRLAERSPFPGGAG